MMIMYLISLLYLFSLFSFVSCSAEEVDKLRSEWRDKVQENQEIMKETRKLRESLVIDSSFQVKMIKIHGHLTQVKEYNAMLLNKNNNEEKKKALKDLETIKKKAEGSFEYAKKLLLTKEIEFEKLWGSEYFIKSFDFILKNSLMAPVPKFPQIYAENADEIRKALGKAAELIQLENKVIQKRRKIVKSLIWTIKGIENEFKTFNFTEIIRDNFETLKMRVLTTKIKEEGKKSKLLEFIDLYEKNQQEELKGLDKKNLNDSTVKMKRYLDFLLSTDQWKLRVGHGVDAIDASVDDNAKNNNKNIMLIDEKITNASRIKTMSKLRETQYIQLIKHNDTEKMKYAALIGENKLYKFMVKKCAKIVEGMHRYLVKADDKVGKGMYSEVIEDLVK